MTENTLNNVGNAVEVDNAVDNTKVDEPEKLYTQADIDRAVQSRVAKMSKKADGYKEEIAELKAEMADYRALSSMISEGGNIKGSPKEQIKLLKNQYDLDDETVNSILNKSANNDERDLQRNMARYNADRFVAESDAEDIQEEYDRIDKIPVAERSLTDKAMYKAIKEHQSAKQNTDLKETISKDKKWLEKEVGDVELADIVTSKDFKDFIAETDLTTSQAIKMFVKFNGKEKIIEKFSKTAGEKTTVSTGSVKDSGASKLKEYYSPEDVDNLSEKDLDDPEIFKRVRESMTKW